MERSLLKQAWCSLLSNKLRTLLAILGILVGTASVVTLVTSGKIATDTILAEFKNLGAEMFSVHLQPKKRKENHRHVQFDDIDKLNNRIASYVKNVSPYTTAFAQINVQGHRLQGNVVGATEELARIIDLQMAQGNFIARAHAYKRFAVVGSEIGKHIMEQTKQPPVGQQLYLGDQIYTIIGVLKPWRGNHFFYLQVNRLVIVPLESTLFLGNDININELILRTKKNSNVDALQETLVNYFQKLDPNIKVMVQNAKAILKSMQKQQRILTLFLGLIGGIALFVGGIGIMNIMLVSVAERKREIGVRKALGATRRDIQALFLSEAVLMALVGGLLGISIGLCLTYLISWLAKWTFQFYLQPIAIGFVVSFLTGVFFGVYPAWRAAKLHPIEALRYD